MKLRALKHHTTSRLDFMVNILKLAPDAFCSDAWLKGVLVKTLHLTSRWRYPKYKIESRYSAPESLTPTMRVLSAFIIDRCGIKMRVLGMFNPAWLLGLSYILADNLIGSRANHLLSCWSIFSRSNLPQRLANFRAKT